MRATRISRISELSLELLIIIHAMLLAFVSNNIIDYIIYFLFVFNFILGRLCDVVYGACETLMRNEECGLYGRSICRFDVILLVKSWESSMAEDWY